MHNKGDTDVWMMVFDDDDVDESFPIIPPVLCLAGQTTFMDFTNIPFRMNRGIAVAASSDTNIKQNPPTNCAWFVVVYQPF